MASLHFAFYGRMCAIIYFLAAVGISVWQMIWYPSFALPLGSYTLVCGLIVGLIELPICFACCKPCKTLAGYLRIVMGYWVVRGVLYAGEIFVLPIASLRRSDLLRPAISRPLCGWLCHLCDARQ